MLQRYWKCYQMFLSQSQDLNFTIISSLFSRAQKWRSKWFLFAKIQSDLIPAINYYNTMMPFTATECLNKRSALYFRNNWLHVQFLWAEWRSLLSLIYLNHFSPRIYNYPVSLNRERETRYRSTLEYRMWQGCRKWKELLDTFSLDKGWKNQVFLNALCSRWIWRFLFGF